MPSAPTLHTFDPQIAGKIGLNVDPPSAGVTQVIWYVSSSHGGPYNQTASTMITTGLDGCSLILDADSTTRYWVAKVYDPTGYSSISNEVATAASAGPTAEQLINQALGITLSPGDIIDVYPPVPTTSKTVNADGSLS